MDSQAPTLRIERVAIAELRQDPRNARVHGDRNLQAIRDSLARFGQRLPIVVRHGQIVGGNATSTAAEDLGWTHLDVTPADDLSEQEALALAVALNRTGELASWDGAVLVEALSSLPTLEGTGFSAEELAELEAALDTTPFDPAAEWQGMPEYESENLGSVFHVVVHFKSDEHADEFFKLIDREKRKTIWWPERGDYQGASYKHAYVTVGPGQSGNGAES